MQPEYNAQVRGLIQQWYDAAEKDVMNYGEKKQLYKNTANFVKVLQELKNSGQIEKVKALSDIIIQTFNDHGVGESELLARWVARHTTANLAAKEFKGAYKSLHQLFQLVADTQDYPQAFTTDNDDSQIAWQLSSIINVDAASLKYLERRDLSAIPKVIDIENLIFSELDTNTIQSMKEVSKHYNNYFKLQLIIRLNSEEISTEDLGINSITELIEYFGKENCSKITRLDLTPFYKEIGEDDYTYCIPIEKINISEFFPNLKIFTIRSYNLPININELNLPKNLESLTISECLHADWNSIGNFTSLKNLDVSCNQIGDGNLAFLKELRSLENINLFENQLRDQRLLEKKPLISLNIKNNLIKDISFIENLPSLTTFCFGNSIPKTTNTLINLSLCNYLHLLQKCPSLISLDAPTQSMTDELFEFLKLPKIKHLSVGSINNPNFLSACTSLESMSCQFTDLNHLLKCPQIRKLAIANYHNIDKLPDLKNLEEIELKECSVYDLSALEKIPSLKKVTIIDCKNISDEDTQTLISKGITVLNLNDENF